MQKISLPFLRSEILRVGDIKPTSVIKFDIVNKSKCKSSLANFNFSVVQVGGLQKKDNATVDSNTTKKSPFVAPFEDGLYISRINETHLLLFNKFAIVKNHL